MSIYVCSVCGYIAFTGGEEACPVCKMPKDKFVRNDRIFEESAEKSKEAAIKHVPKITINKKCGLIPEQSCLDVIVRIGATLHPMESSHFIQFIDCYVDDKYIARLMLTPGVFAAGCFHLKTSGLKVTVVENCNLHGYWKIEEKL
jgi:desulfoferrodoxin-like iron-binding protein